MIDGSEIYEWASGDEVFTATPVSEVHELSRAEWNAPGNAAFTDR